MGLFYGREVWWAKKNSLKTYENDKKGIEFSFKAIRAKIIEILYWIIPNHPLELSFTRLRDHRGSDLSVFSSKILKYRNKWGSSSKNMYVRPRIVWENIECKEGAFSRHFKARVCRPGSTELNFAKITISLECRCKISISGTQFHSKNNDLYMKKHKNNLSNP